MPKHVHRREWLKQSALAALSTGFSLQALAGEDGLPRRFGNDRSLVNLGSNENPYGLCDGAKQAVKEMSRDAHRYQYNILSLRSFRKTLAEYYGLSENHIIATPGSGNALVELARYFGPRGPVVSANPTFGTLPNTVKRFEGKVIEVALDAGKVHDLRAMRAAITPDTSLVYLCNPANPTGTILKPAAIKEFIAEVSTRTTVVVDEAYIDYLEAPDNESMIPLVVNNPNLVIVRTFSKLYAMAGMRLGFICAHPGTIRKLEDSTFANSPYYISALSMHAGLAALQDKTHCGNSIQKNAAARTFTQNSLESLGYRVIPSYTNFIFFSLPKFTGDFAKAMLERNIVLRSSDYADGKWCRVSIGLMPEMQQFIQVMKKDFSA